MKSALRLLALLAATAIAAYSAPANSALIKARSIAVGADATAFTEVTVVAGEMRITAAQAIMDNSRRELRLTGGVECESGGVKFKTSEATLSLDDKRVFTLESGNIAVEGAGEDTPSARATTTFGEAYPRTPTQLSR